MHTHNRIEMSPEAGGPGPDDPGPTTAPEAPSMLYSDMASSLRAWMLS